MGRIAPRRYLNGTHTEQCAAVYRLLANGTSYGPLIRCQYPKGHEGFHWNPGQYGRSAREWKTEDSVNKWEVE